MQRYPLIENVAHFHHRYVGKCQVVAYPVVQIIASIHGSALAVYTLTTSLSTPQFVWKMRGGADSCEGPKAYLWWSILSVMVMIKTAKRRDSTVIVFFVFFI